MKNLVYPKSQNVQIKQDEANQLKLHAILITIFVIVQAMNVTNLSAQQVMYVNQVATGTHDGSSWDNAFNSLQDALALASSGDEIWVAAGVYHPDEGLIVTEGDRSATFVLVNGGSIYGGFKGIEGSRLERDWQLNETVLSGDLLGNDDDNPYSDEPTRQDNSYHVVTVSGITQETILDGLTVSGGNANAPGQRGSRGGGIISENSLLSVRNMVIEANAALDGGGGMYNIDSDVKVEDALIQNNYGALPPPVGVEPGGGMYDIDGNLILDNVIFKENWASDGGGLWIQSSQKSTIHNVRFLSNSAIIGGGLYNFHSDPFITNTFFGGNEALSQGGGLTNEVSNPQMTNVIFSGNQANHGGGAIINSQSNPVLINSVFSKNSVVGRGGAILNLYDDEVILINSIFGENTAAQGVQIFNDSTDATSTTTSSFSLFIDEIPDSVMGDGNDVVGDPMFVNPDGLDTIPGTEDDDLRLQAGSPGIDSGNNGGLPPDRIDFDADGDSTEAIPIDFINNQRVFNGGSGLEAVDIGAFEFGAPSILVFNEKVEDRRKESTYTIDVYPIPINTNAIVRVCGSHNDQVTIALYDLTGRRIEVWYKGQLSVGCTNLVEVNGLELASGAYVVRATGKYINSSRSILVLH